MTKKGLIPFILIVSALSANAKDVQNYGPIWSTSNKPKERVPFQFELETINKETYAYENLLRVMDEINRQNNVQSNYTKDYYGTIPKIPDVDIVPIWFDGVQYANTTTVEGRNNQTDTGKYYSKDSIDKMMNSNDKNKFSYNYKENNPRLYFGNGNVVKDIKIENESNFKKEVEKAKASNNERYVVRGEYSPFNSESTGLYNPLEISEKEYKEHFISNGQVVSKNDPKLLNFLSKKMKDKNIDVTVENGELVTTAKDGKKYKVIWNAHPFSMPNMNRDENGDLIGMDPNSKDRYQNTLLTQIFLYKDTNEKGETLYTKDGNIIIKDVLDYKNNNAEIIVGNSYKDYKKLDEIIDDYNKVQNNDKDMTEEKFKEKWKFSTTDFKPFNYKEEILTDFDKVENKKMSEKDFKEKWDIDESDSNYKKVFGNLKDKSKNVKELSEKLANSGEKYIDKLKQIGVNDWQIKYDYFHEHYANEASKKKIKEKYKDKPEVLEILNEYDEDLEKLKDSKLALSQGMKDYIRFSPTGDIKIDRIGKIVDFGGKGRIEGVIDFGEGFNTLRIKENFSGKYGTNIVLSPNTRIKNIDVIEVGGQIGANFGKHGLSGLTSLSMEVDPNHKNSQGYLDNHALQGTWTKDNKVVFKSANSLDKPNDFSIEFIISGIDKDSKIDIGRPLKYTYEGVNYDTKLISDSIVHNLKPINDNHSLYEVNVKDSLKVLSSDENSALKSIVGSNNISYLKNTITASNKKTTFASGESDLVEKNKDLKLFKALRQKVSAKEILANLSNKDLDSKTQEKLEKLITKIQNYEVNNEKYFDRINDRNKSDLEALENLVNSKNEKFGPTKEFEELRSALYYSQREQEAINELKILLDQLYENNIYAKVNKISKEEINVFTPIIVDNDFNFNSKKVQATGGAVSGRFARDKFKGTIYTGYGIYETPLKDNLSLGFVIGGGTSNFHEVINDDLRTVTTNSKIKGSRAYLGFFERMNLKKDLEWVNGIGVQYSEYDVDREMKNNYQSDTYKGKLNTYSGNIYSNLIYNYKINDTLNANIKGGLSYTLVNQDKVKEEDKPLSIEIGDQNFNYLDGQFGIGLTKTVLSNNSTSSLSGTLYTIYGITGYDNKNLKGNIVGSTSEFNIKGENYEKQSLKLKLNYDVNYDSGFNYGLEGSYTKNSNEDNITVGVKAGYTF